MGVLETAGADRTAAAENDSPPQQVVDDPAAVALMETLRAKYGPLMFHQSGGCCDGSSPMCFPLGEFMTGDSDVLLATIGAEGDSPGAPFYMSKPQFEYWKHTLMTTEGRPSISNPSKPL